MDEGAAGLGDWLPWLKVARGGPDPYGAADIPEGGADPGPSASSGFPLNPGPELRMRQGDMALQTLLYNQMMQNGAINPNDPLIGMLLQNQDLVLNPNGQPLSQQIPIAPTPQAKRQWGPGFPSGPNFANPLRWM